MERVVEYSDTRQKKVVICLFGAAELYEGLGTGFLERGRRFERLMNLAQSVCGFLWSEDVKVDVTGDFSQRMAERCYVNN